MKLSHSGSDRYSDCSENYKKHYIEKIRPTWTTSALLFGDALDKTYNEILLDKQQDKLRKTEEYYDIFLKGWTHGTINKDKIYIPTSPSLSYSAKDYDPELLTQEDYEDVSKRIKDGDIVEADLDELIARKKENGWHTLTPEEKSYHNLHFWHSLKNKAKYFVTGYIDLILPRIKKVHAVQVAVDAVNESGDAFTGIIDAILDIDDYGTVITDNKTSSSSYKADSVKTSKQLAKYVYFEGPKYDTNKGGYLVTKKQLKRIENKTCTSCGHKETSSHQKCNAKVNGKRCNGEWGIEVTFEPVVQVIVDEIDVEFQEQAVVAVDNNINAIKSGVFEQNLSKCNSWYGSRCVYYGLCHHDSMNGLVDMSKKEEL